MSTTTMRHRPRLAALWAAALAAPLAIVVATGQPAAAQTVEAAASAQARHTGRPVTVAAASTADTRTLANPDGSYTLTSSRLPRSGAASATAADPEAYVQSYHPTTVRLNPGDGLRTGFSDSASAGKPGITRGFLRFDGLGSLQGKYVQEAHLQLTQVQRACAGSYTLDVNATGTWPKPSTLDWRNQPTRLSNATFPTATRTVNANGGYQVDLTGLLRGAQNAGYTSLGLSMRMADESARCGYRQWGADPDLVVTYSSAPDQPGGLAEVNGGRSVLCDTVSPGGWLSAAVNDSIDLHYTVSSPDTTAALVANTWVSADGGAYTQSSTNLTYSGGSLPVDHAVTVTDGGSYRWYAQTTGPGGSSAPSPVCYFRYDATAPSGPVASSADYPPQGPTTVTAGGTGTITVTAGDAGTNPSGLAGFNYNIDGTSINSGGVETFIAATGGTASVPVPLAALHFGTNTVWVQSVDNAGNVSQPAHYDFFVQQSAFPVTRTPGDVDGDGRPDLVTVDTAGNLRLFTNPGGVSVDPTGDTATDPLQYGGKVLFEATRSPRWPGSGFAGALVSHAGSLAGANADDLFILQSGQLGLARNINGNATQWTTVGVTKPACSACANYDSGDWSSMIRMLAVPSPAPGAGPSLLTVEYVNDVASLWLYPSRPGGLGAPILVSAGTSTWHWEDWQIVAASAVPGGTGTALWVRNPSTGQLGLFRDVEAGIPDPDGALTVVAAGGYDRSAYPLITATGEADASGNLSLLATDGAGQLAVIPTTVTGGGATVGAAHTISTGAWASHEIAVENSDASYNNSGIGQAGTGNQPFDTATDNAYDYADSALNDATLDNGAASFCAPGRTLDCPAGLTPAGAVLVPLPNGSYVFTLPAAWSGRADNYQADGQILAAPEDLNFDSAHYISFLGAATTGSADGASVDATVTFTNGDTQHITITFADWMRNTDTAPVAGNTVVASMGYRYTAATGTQDPTPTYLFASAEIPILDNGSPLASGAVQIASITLGTNSAVHIFADAVS